MIFIGKPLELFANRSIRIRCRFNENGQYETDDDSEIYALNKENYETLKQDKKVHTCKYCGMEFDNVGVMLAHIRKEHKGKEHENEN